MNQRFARILAAGTMMLALTVSAVTVTQAQRGDGTGGGNQRGDHPSRDGEWRSGHGEWSSPYRPVAYINADTGIVTLNPNIDPISGCDWPSRRDTQPLSDPGAVNNNVHVDACLFGDGMGMMDGHGNRGSLSRMDLPATFESHGPGYISSCPDPDDGGPKTSTLTDTDGDGMMDRCVQSGYQMREAAGNTEFHARFNNNTTPGTQIVVFCYDPELNGCWDARPVSRIVIHWE